MDVRDRITRLVTFVLILVLGFVLYRVLITPKRQGINSLRRNLKNIELQISGALGEEVILGTGAAGEEQLETFLQKLTLQIPSERDIPKIINKFLTEVGKGLNLDYGLIQPRSLKPKGHYKKLPIELKFSITYPQFNTYLTQLKSLPEVFVIESMDMRRMPGKADRLNVHLVVSAFVMPGAVEQKIEAITLEAYPEEPKASPFLPKAVPTKPKATEAPSEAAVSEKPASPLVLQGILLGELKSAIINDQLIYIDDLIEGYRLINIKKDSVVLQKGRSIIRLRLEDKINDYRQ
jgi:Tfp pilus assembly protein PilO